MEKIPKVVASWYLTAFWNLAVYNLDNWQRVIRFSELVYALRGVKTGKIGNYLNPENIRKYLPEKLWPRTDKEEWLDRKAQWVTLAEIDGRIIETYDSEDFIDICVAFITANDNKELLSIPQQEIVERARRFLIASAKSWFSGLIDEATGYQYIRPSDELSIKFALYLSEDKRDWEKTFPDDIWYEFGRLTNWKGSLKKRPQYWGKLVNEFIYDMLDADIAKYLRENKPSKETWVRYHQWLTENKWVRALVAHIWQMIGISKTCTDINELRYEMQKSFSKDIFQPRLFTRETIRTIDEGEKEAFDKIMGNAIKSAPWSRETD